MKNFLSTAVFVIVLLALGGMALAAGPLGSETAAQPGEAPQVQEPEPQAVTATQWNAIGIPLDSPTISTAADLIAEMTGASRVQKWDAASGTWIYYQPSDIFVPGTNFAVEVGDAIFASLDSTSGSTFSLVGDVPVAGSVSFNMVGAGACQWNAFTVPLDQSGITDAATLIASFDANTAPRVQMWDASVNSWVYYQPGDIFVPGTNFPVAIGYPYFACLTAPQVWP